MIEQIGHITITRYEEASWRSPRAPNITREKAKILFANKNGIFGSYTSCLVCHSFCESAQHATSVLKGLEGLYADIGLYLKTVSIREQTLNAYRRPRRCFLDFQRFIRPRGYHGRMVLKSSSPAHTWHSGYDRQTWSVSSTHALSCDIGGSSSSSIHHHLAVQRGNSQQALRSYRMRSKPE